MFTLDFTPTPEEKDVTADYLTNYQSPFLHTDERVNTVNYVSRYFKLETGTAASGWVLENVRTEGDVTTGAYVDTYFNSDLSCVTGDLGFASSLTDQRTYQTITLPAGLYRLEVVPGYKAFSPTGSYIVATKGDTLAGNIDLENTLAYASLNDKVLEFYVSEDNTTISLGFIFNLSSSLAVSIDEIRLTSIPYEYHEAGELTGVKPLTDEKDKGQTPSTYDLQGRKIKGKPDKGIIIRDGKKVLN